MSDKAYIADTGYRPKILSVEAVKWTPKTVTVIHPSYGKTRMDRMSSDIAIYENRRDAEVYFKNKINARISDLYEKIERLTAAISTVSEGREPKG